VLPRKGTVFGKGENTASVFGKKGKEILKDLDSTREVLGAEGKHRLLPAKKKREIS